MPMADLSMRRQQKSPLRPPSKRLSPRVSHQLPTSRFAFHKVLTFIHSPVPTPKFNPFLLHHSLTIPSPPPPTVSFIASLISQVLYSTLKPLFFHHSRTSSCPFFV